MAQFESVEVPFKQFGNRRGLTREQIENDQYLTEFFNRFRSSFELHPVCDVVLFIEPEGLHAS